MNKKVIAADAKNKPLTVAREEFIEKLAKLINESGLPLFAVESILRDFALETKEASRWQYERDKAAYEAGQASATSKNEKDKTPDGPKGTQTREAQERR